MARISGSAPGSVRPRGHRPLRLRRALRNALVLTVGNPASVSSTTPSLWTRKSRSRSRRRWSTGGSAACDPFDPGETRGDCPFSSAAPERPGFGRRVHDAAEESSRTTLSASAIALAQYSSGCVSRGRFCGSGFEARAGLAISIVFYPSRLSKHRSQPANAATRNAKYVTTVNHERGRIRGSLRRNHKNCPV